MQVRLSPSWRISSGVEPAVAPAETARKSIATGSFMPADASMPASAGNTSFAGAPRLLERSGKRGSIRWAPHGGAGLADQWHVYILECEDGTLYTGVTKDVARR